MATEFVFKITEHIANITEYGNGWNKELNLVAWNDAKPKYDLRDWNPDHTSMTRGITLHEKEARLLTEALQKHFKK